MEADVAFDQALDIDDSHWAARFSKAVSYTFWPDFLGKKSSAIENFEILVQQQEQGPTQGEYAQTYFYLGNLYEQRGDATKAQEIWQRGANLYPQNPELQGKIKY